MATPKTFLLCALLIAGIAHANEQKVGGVHPALTEKFTLHAGLFFPDRNFKIQVDGLGTGPNPTIDFEDEFGLNKSDQVFALEFGWRFSEKWSLVTQYFETSGARTAALDKDIEWENVIFAQGSNATAGQEFSVIRAFIGRRFNTDKRLDVGIGGGLHWFELGAFVEGEIIVGDLGSEFRRESVSVAVPLPNVGVWYNYSLTPRWAFSSRVDYLNADIDDFSGSLVNLGVGVNYRAFDKIGVGLSYNRLELDLSISRPDWRGGTETTYKGLYIFASGYW